jgi:hypothetical protein
MYSSVKKKNDDYYPINTLFLSKILELVVVGAVDLAI